MAVGRKDSQPRNVKYAIFPNWNPYKRSRNISLCAMAWSSILLLALVTGVMIMTLRKNSYHYGNCRLHAFSDVCHICYVSPLANGGNGCEKLSKDTCIFVVLATSRDGYAYKGPYEAEYQPAPWTNNNGTLVPTNPSFRCCPEDYNCCDWLDPDSLTFCDMKCSRKAGRPHGWPCRFRLDNSTATEVEYREYWKDEQAIRNGQAACLAVFTIVFWIIRDPCGLRGRKLRDPDELRSTPVGAEKKPKASAVAAEVKQDDEFDKYAWTPRTAANAMRGLLSPLRRPPGVGRAFSPFRGEPIEVFPPRETTPPRPDGPPVTALRTYAERRVARRALSAPGATRQRSAAIVAADGQSALARADWALARRGEPQKQPRERVPAPPGRMSLEAWA